jgi:hypothetical protein
MPDEYAYGWRVSHPQAPSSDSAAIGDAMARHVAAVCLIDVDQSIAGAAFAGRFRLVRGSSTNVTAARRYVVDSVVLKPRQDPSIFSSLRADPLTQTWGDSARVSLHVIDVSPGGQTRMTFHYVFARGAGTWTFVSRALRRAEGPIRKLGTIPPLAC